MSDRTRATRLKISENAIFDSFTVLYVDVGRTSQEAPTVHQGLLQG
jgi:hypothetical protein